MNVVVVAGFSVSHFRLSLCFSMLSRWFEQRQQATCTVVDRLTQRNGDQLNTRLAAFTKPRAGLVLAEERAPVHSLGGVYDPSGPD